MMRNLARCAGVASDSRHDQANGTLITRPSDNRATISFLVMRTSSIRGSLFAAVLIPRLQYRCAMRHDDPADHIQLPGSKTVIACQLQRLKPELASLVFLLDMDVRRLAAIETREEEPVRPGNTANARHSSVLVPQHHVYLLF